MRKWPLRRRLRIAGARLAEALDPAPAIARRLVSRRGAPPRVVVLGVYLPKRATVLRRVVEQAEAESFRVALWSVDPSQSELSRVTVGAGPGARTELLNRVWELVRDESWDLVVVVDDDVEFEERGLRTFVQLVLAGDLGLAQPAHSARSWVAHPITARCPLRLARETTFVEVGPVFAVARPWVGSVLPFPAGSGMGWGVGVGWHQLREQGCRLGVVDAAPIRHLFAHGGTYDRAPEEERLTAALAARGLTNLRDAQRDLAHWWPWQSRPPWRKAAP